MRKCQKRMNIRANLTCSESNTLDIIVFMSKEIIFHAIRHGRTEWNDQRRVQGHIDQPLSATGLGEVHSLGQELQQKRDELGIDLIYSSDLKRAVVTADVLSYYLQLPYHIDERLRERNYGIFEGKTWEELQNQFGISRIEGYHPEGGESLEQFDNRIKTAVVDILSLNSDKTVLFVSHGGAIRSKLKQFGNLNGPEGIGYDIQNLSLHSFSIPDIVLSIGSGK